MGGVCPHLERVSDLDRFPTAARVGAGAGASLEAAYDSERAFEFGLGRTLDGVEALICLRGSLLDGR